MMKGVFLRKNVRIADPKGWAENLAKRRVNRVQEKRKEKRRLQEVFVIQLHVDDRTRLHLRLFGVKEGGIPSKRSC